MKTILGSILLATCACLLAACGLFKAEVGLPPTEAMGGAIKIMGIPLLESVNWCAGSPCRLAPPAGQTIIYNNPGGWGYPGPPRPY
jgi:hypothetical protein